MDAPSGGIKDCGVEELAEPCCRNRLPSPACLRSILASRLPSSPCWLAVWESAADAMKFEIPRKTDPCPVLLASVKSSRCNHSFINGTPWRRQGYLQRPIRPGSECRTRALPVLVPSVPIPRGKVLSVQAGTHKTLSTPSPPAGHGWLAADVAIRGQLRPFIGLVGNLVETNRPGPPTHLLLPPIP